MMKPKHQGKKSTFWPFCGPIFLYLPEQNITLKDLE